MRVLLIDDHPIFTQGFKLLLAELDDSIELILAGSLAQGMQCGPEFGLVLLDLHLPGIDGLEGLSQVQHTFPDIPVVMLSSEEDAQVIRQFIAHGAAGFIPKSSTPQVLIAAVRLVLSGGTYLPPVAFDLPNVTPLAPPVLQKQHLGLSERQLTVFLKVAQGKSNKVIARELNLAEGTVKTHVSTAFRVLNVSNRTEAVYRAAQLGFSAGAG